MKKVFSFTAVLMLIASVSILAQDRTLTSSGGQGDWSNNGAWDGGQSPTASESVLIASTSQTTLNIDENAACLSFTIESGWSGTITFESTNTLTVNGAWTNNSSTVTFSGTVAIIFNGSATIGGTSTTTFTNLTISSGTTTLAGDIELTGNWTNNSSAVLTGYTVTFNGTSSQTIGGSSSTTFDGLTINNSSGVSVNTASTVNGTLTLTSGLLTLGSNNLTLGGSSSIGGTPTASNMIVPTGTGELRKTYTATGSFTFPVGDNTGTAEYSPATLNFTSGSFSSAYAGINLDNAKHPNNTSTTDFINRYWTVTQSGITGFSCDATFTYVTADINGTETNLYCGSYNGSSWTLLDVVDADNNDLSGTVTSFSGFTGGEIGAMPVELTSFAASIAKSGVLLNWRTVTEVNNYGFEVQRSSKPEKWDVLGFVEGHGNTYSPKEYEFIDDLSSYPDKSHLDSLKYRLKQIDLDGAFEIYNLTAAVDLRMVTNIRKDLFPDKFELHQNYPNPFNPATTIKYTIPEVRTPNSELRTPNSELRTQEQMTVTLRIYDILGREVVALVNKQQSPGSYSVSWDAAGQPSGVYFYKLSAGSYTQTRKMLLSK